MREIQYTPIRNGMMMTEANIRRERLRANAKRNRRKKLMKICLTCFYAIMIIGIGILISAKTTEKMEVKAAQESVVEIQEYIIRYGTAHCYGAVIETEDGNIWTLEDAPEFEEGSKVRVLFNSCGTETVEDDIIIDVTEHITKLYIDN